MYSKQLRIIVSLNLECADWRNPTSEAIADAKSDGIDLTDPLVIDMLEECEREARVDGKRRLGGQDEPQHLVSDSEQQ